VAQRRSSLKLRGADPERVIGEINPEGLRPLGDRVLVEVLEENWERPSGLLIPENVRPRSCQGIVAEIGMNCTLFDEDDPWPGDHVLFKPYQEEIFWWEGREFILMPFDDLLGRIEE